MLQASLSQDEIAQELLLRERQIALLQLEASVLAFQLLENGFLEDAGYNSPTDWLRFNCHLTDKVASDRIQSASSWRQCRPAWRRCARARSATAT